MTSAQLQYYERWGEPEPVVERFEMLGILPHTKPNAIGLWPNEQLCLVWCAMQCDPNQHWLEVGSFCGGSTILLGYAQDALEGSGKILAVDLNFNPMFDLNLKRSKLTQVRKLAGDSLWVLNEIRLDKDISFAFLDGWHSFRNVVKEFEAIKHWLTDDAIIGFHDVSPKMYTHDNNYINETNNQVLANYASFIEDESQNFLIDQAVAYLCVQYNYEIIDIPVREKLSYFKETGLTGWVRGKTSPHNAFTAIRKKA